MVCDRTTMDSSKPVGKEQKKEKSGEFPARFRGEKQNNQNVLLE
jgi:hypothetical protein